MMRIAVVLSFLLGLLPVTASAEPTEVPPAELAGDHQPPELAGPAPEPEIPGPSIAEEEDLDEEELGEEDFCGGEPTLLDQAYMLIDEGELTGAQQTLVEGLQSGAIGRWERPDALALLAESQLRQGKHRSAVRNYRLARTLEPRLEEATGAGLAVALQRAGLPTQAHEAAVAHLEGHCVGSNEAVTCYGAQLVVSLTARDRVERFHARTEAAAIESVHTEWREDINTIRWLLGLTEIEGRAK